MPKDNKKIFAVFKTHFDYGYTDRKENVLRSYCEETLEQVLTLCEKTQKKGKELCFKWTVCSFLLIKMYRNASLKNQARMMELIKNGQIACHALPFTMHTPLLDERLAKEMFMWTDEYVDIFQQPFPIAAKMTDVPGHTSGIIRLLTERGVKFLHLGKNGASLSPDVPMLFWWEDLQGNRILTMYNRDYGSDLKPPKNWKYPVWLAFCHNYDNAGLQEEGYIENIATQVNNQYKLQTGTLDDFARELLKCDLSDLPIVRGELSDTWIHGVGSYPEAVSCFRRSKKEFYRLEELAKRQNIDIEEEKRAFYENALIFTEHTFGCSCLKYLGYDRVYDKKELQIRRRQDASHIFAENSWKDEKAFSIKMQEICKRLSERLTVPVSEGESSEPFELEYDDRYVYLNFGGKRLKLYYEYRIFGAESVHKFAKKYLTRFFVWSISDFGRLRYPEISDRKYLAKIKEVKKNGEMWEISFVPEENSVKTYGNFASYTLQLSKRDGDDIDIVFKGEGKQAINLVEAGNFVVEIEGKAQTFSVEQLGCEIDVNKDIVRNGNQILWAMDEYAKIDDIILYSYDAPLVSFGKNAICRYNGGRQKKEKASIVINLFNNHWGTNFPQWLEGDFSFEFVLKRDKKRELFFVADRT